MSMNIHITGLDRTIANTALRGQRLKHAVGIILQKSISEVQRFAKPVTPVDTGRLRGSIGGGGFQGGLFQKGEGIEFGEKFASIGPTVEYAKYVHRRVPFMYRGAQAALGTIKKVAQEEVNKALK